MKKYFLWLSLLFVSACSTVTVEDYASNKPLMVVEDYFNGALTAHGIVKNRSGKVIRYFNATIDASWDNGVGILDETFVFNDGEKQNRIWTLMRKPLGGYIATANDVIGQAQLNMSGNSVFLEYVLRIPYGDNTLDLTIDDRMYLVSDKILINESMMMKWGIEVGQLMLVIIKSN